MADIEDFVQVNVDRKTRSLDVKSFGTPMILAYHTHYADRVREYKQADDLLDDGFLATDKVYFDALAVKAQNPSPKTFKIGRRALPDTQIVHIIPVDLTAGLVHTITINDVAYTVTNPGSPTIANVSALIAALTVPGATMANATTWATCTATTAGKVNRVKVTKGLKLLDATANAGIVTDLGAIFAADSNWYSLALDSYSSAVVTAAMVWVEAKAIIMAAQSADWTVKDSGTTTDVASLLKASNYTRVFGSWSGELGGSRAAAWAARIVAVNPGLENPAFKLLGGQAYDELTTTERATILGKRFSVYEKTAGQNHTFDGKIPSGEYIDQVIGADWIKFRMQEEVFGVFLNNANVPQTNVGIGMVESAARAVLKRASSASFPILDPTSIVVSVPDILDVPSADRLARNLPDVTWTARYQGSFNSVKPINGSISV